MFLKFIGLHALWNTYACHSVLIKAEKQECKLNCISSRKLRNTEDCWTRQRSVSFMIWSIHLYDWETKTSLVADKYILWWYISSAKLPKFPFSCTIDEICVYLHLLWCNYMPIYSETSPTVFNEPYSQVSVPKTAAILCLQTKRAKNLGSGNLKENVWWSLSVPFTLFLSDGKINNSLKTKVLIYVIYQEISFDLEILGPECPIKVFSFTFYKCTAWKRK